MYKKLTLFEWYLCCLFCNKNKYNKINTHVYKYGDTYTRNEITGELILNKTYNCIIM